MIFLLLVLGTAYVLFRSTAYSLVMAQIRRSEGWFFLAHALGLLTAQSIVLPLTVVLLRSSMLSDMPSLLVDILATFFTGALGTAVLRVIRRSAVLPRVRETGQKN